MRLTDFESRRVDELAPATLASYKTKAGAAATAADAAGDRKTADRRFSGIVKATKKQFDQDAKGMSEGLDDTVRFEIDSENAYNHVMDQFGSVIDWDGDTMVVPRKYWGAIQELAYAANGEASEEHGLAENYPKHQDLSGISTDKLKAYVAKLTSHPMSGEGAQVRRVRAELERRAEPNFGTKDDEEENQWWIDHDVKEGMAEGKLKINYDSWLSKVPNTINDKMKKVLRVMQDGKVRSRADMLRAAGIDPNPRSPGGVAGMEGTDYYLYKKGLLDVVDIVKGQKYFKISKNASQGVLETNVAKYKDLGATNQTTHFIKNVTTGKIVSPHRSLQDAEDSLVGNMRDSNDKFKIVRARKGVAEGSAADGSVNYTLGHTPDAEYVYSIYRDGKKEGTYHSVAQAREIMGNMKLTSPNREYKIKRGARNKMAGPASQLPEQGMTKGHGNYAGDRPVNLGGVSMKKIQIGDTVRYIDQKAQVIDMSRDRERARITIPSSATTKTVLTSDLRQLGRGVLEGNDQQLSVQQLATVSDEALDTAYGYGRSSPGNTFGWQANLKSAAYAKQMIDQGVTDIEAISDAIHQGWNTTAQAFVQNPEQFDDTEKLRAAGKLEAKLQQRAKLMNIDYDQLPDDEQEKDRVVARALLQALTGQQDAATDNKQLDELSPATLARYKTKAGAAATAADSAGDRKTGDRRFSGIVKATKKQFDQDAKQSAQAVHESRLRLMASIIKTQ